MSSREHPRSAESAGAASRVGGAGRTVTLGLLSPPQIPEAVTDYLADELPRALSERVSDRVSWEIPVIRDPRVPDVEDIEEDDETIEVHDWRQQEGWDLAVCVTDLPLLFGPAAVVADAPSQRDVALVSLPALGAWNRARRTLETIVMLVREVLGESVGLGQRDSGGRVRSSYIGRLVPGDDDRVLLVAPAGRAGRLRLLAGMVRANRPFRVVLGLSYALAAALGTGAYVVWNPSLWPLGDSFGWMRLLALTVVSVAAMVGWLIVVHHLWRRTTGPEPEERGKAMLFNATTIITLTVGTISLYAALFTLVILVAAAFVPEGFFGETLQHPVGPVDYVMLAWMASSLATLVGALGSGLETSVDVREAAYNYHRERRKHREKHGDPKERDPR